MAGLQLNPFKRNPLRQETDPVLVIIPAQAPEREQKRNLLTPVSSGLASQIAAALSATVQPGAPTPTRKVVDERVQYREAPEGSSPDRRTSFGSSAHDVDEL